MVFPAPFSTLRCAACNLPAEYRLAKRKEFEDTLRRVGRWNPAAWVKYAQWEEAQRDFRRARSVWERALDINHRNVSVWLK